MRDDFKSGRDALRSAARHAPLARFTGVTFKPTPAGMESLHRAVAKKQVAGLLNYSYADAARDILDWVARTEASLRRPETEEA